MKDKETSRLVTRWLIREIMGTIMVGVILFWSAGDWTWTWGWAVVAIYALWVAANAILLIPRHPDLLAERAQRNLEGMKSWDKTLTSIIGILTLVKYILAGLDIRNGWSATIPVWVHIVALLLCAFGYALGTWAMTENAFFSMIVRYQEDRGHQVCNTGPYKFVRHPAYIGTILFELMIPLVLGSWWTLILGGLLAILMTVRTSLEDKMLQEELPGYMVFTQENALSAYPWHLVIMTQTQNKPSPKDVLKMAFQIVFGISVLLALLFLPAGRLDWWAAWGFIIVYLVTVFVAVAVLQRKDPDLIQERRQTQENVKGWDKVITALFSLFFIPLSLITSGLDQRFGWTDSFPVIVQILAVILGISGFVLVFWGMAANTYFSSYLRIQDDRGHSTITSGPYRYVRHPGYLGMIVSALVIPLVLGSWWALIPGGLAASVMILRTALEDKTLQEELPGYQAFTQKTRYRLVPGVW